jgi:hypothetical protein
MWLAVAKSLICACVSDKVILRELYIDSEEELSIDNGNFLCHQ